MRITILVNPIAGAGNAVKAAEAACRALRDAHDVDVVTTRPVPAEDYLPQALEGCDLAVIVGGDGTVRHAVDAVARAGAAIYQVPFGTENLFSREWGMSRSVDALVEAVEADRHVMVDRGLANGVPFLLMASIGFDAEVAHDLAQHRRGAIRHASYLLPILRQLVRWRPERLNIEVDGETFAQGRGVGIVANSRQYAARLDPARTADMTSGRLEVVWLPCPVRGWVLRWIIALALRPKATLYGARTCRGRAVTIEAAKPVRYQVDGDPPQRGPEKIERLAVEILPADLRVLLPVKR